MFFLYILYSPGFDKYYVGRTEDMDARLKRHNGGHNISTKPYIPWELALLIRKETRSEAAVLELKLKNLSKSRIVSTVLT